MPELLADKEQDRRFTNMIELDLQNVTLSASKLEFFDTQHPGSVLQYR